MTLGDKYSDIIKELYDTYSISNPSGNRLGGNRKKAEGVSAFLQWAIQTDDRLQEIGEIGVAAVAAATGHSRSTVAEAVAQLVKLGMLQPRLKAPYRIISRRPRFEDALTFASQVISITETLVGQEHGVFDRLLPIEEYSDAPEIRRFIAEQLERTPDALAAIKAGSSDSVWAGLQRGRVGKSTDPRDIRLFSRLRIKVPTILADRRATRPFLFELSFICVEKPHGPALTKQIDHLRSMEVTSISVFQLLKRTANIDSFAPGRNRLTVSAIDAPPSLFERIIGLTGQPLNLDRFAPPQALLKWNYGTFLPSSSEPLLILSVSYVDTEELKVAARNMDVEF